MKRITPFLIITMAIVVTITASPIDARCGILGRTRGVVSFVLPRGGGGIRERIQSRRQDRQGRRQNRQTSRQSVMARHAMGGHDMHAASVSENYSGNFLAPVPDSMPRTMASNANPFSTISGREFSTIPTHHIVAISYPIPRPQPAGIW